MRVGFTGTRDGMTERQTTALGAWFADHAFGPTGEHCEFHHGDCIGADDDAADLAEFFACTVISHPPSDSSKRAFAQSNIVLPCKPYIERNHDIVDACDVLIAAPKTLIEQLRSGTWATIRYARKTNTPVVILEP